MKNKVIAHSHEAARIYKHNYKPSLNIFRLFRSVLGVLITGQPLAARRYRHIK